MKTDNNNNTQSIQPLNCQQRIKASLALSCSVAKVTALEFGPMWCHTWNLYPTHLFWSLSKCVATTNNFSSKKVQTECFYILVYKWNCIKWITTCTCTTNRHNQALSNSVSVVEVVSACIRSKLQLNVMSSRLFQNLIFTLKKTRIKVKICSAVWSQREINNDSSHVTTDTGSNCFHINYQL